MSPRIFGARPVHVRCTSGAQPISAVSALRKDIA